MIQNNPYDGQRIPPEGDSHDERIEELEKKLEASTGFALDLAQKLDELRGQVKAASLEALNLQVRALAKADHDFDRKLQSLTRATRIHEAAIASLEREV